MKLVSCHVVLKFLFSIKLDQIKIVLIVNYLRWNIDVWLPLAKI